MYSKRACIFSFHSTIWFLSNGIYDHRRSYSGHSFGHPTLSSTMRLPHPHDLHSNSTPVILLCTQNYLVVHLIVSLHGPHPAALWDLTLK